MSKPLRGGRLFCSLITLIAMLTSLSFVALAAPQAQAAPQDYSAAASGELISLSGALLNLPPLLNVDVGRAEASVNSASNSAKGEGSNLGLSALNILGLTLSKVTATSPPATDPPSKALLGLNLSPLANLGLLTADAGAFYTGSTCPQPVNGESLLSHGYVQAAGLELGNVPLTTIKLGSVGVADKEMKTKVVGPSIASTATAQVADIMLLNNRVRVAVSDQVRLEARSDGTTGTSSLNNVLVRVYVDGVLSATLTVGSGSSIGLNIDLGGLLSSQLTIGVGTYVDQSSGAVGKGSLDSIVIIKEDVRSSLLGSLASVNLRIGGMDAQAHGAQGGIDCGLPVRCDQLPQWPGFIHKFSALPSDEYATLEEAKANCLLACPKATSSTNTPTDWVRTGRSEAFIPILASPDTTTDEGRGEYCFLRETPQKQKVVRNVTVGGPTTGAPVYWLTAIHDGMGPGRKPGAGFDSQQKEKETAYGALTMDCLATADPSTCWPTTAQMNAAIAQDATASRAELELSADNRRALAEGGVMNVRDEAVNLPHITFTGTPEICERGRMGRYEFLYSTTAIATMLQPTLGAWSNNCGGANLLEGPVEPGTADLSLGWHVDPEAMELVYEAIFNGATTQLQQVWQALSTHCNYESLDYLASVNQSKLRERTTNRKVATYSAYAITRAYSQVGQLPFGALAGDESNETGFYNRQCAYDGVLSGPRSNQLTTSFMRDGELRATHGSLYRPDGSASGTLTAKDGSPVPLVHDDGTDALRTVMTRWTEGTPTPSSPGSLTTFTLDNQPIFWNTTRPFPLLTSLDSSPVESSQEWAILNGQQTDILWSAIWPSDKAQPQVFQLRWEYAPQVANYIPTDNVGFAAPGGGQTYVKDAVAAKLRGAVYSRTDGVPTQARVEEAFTTTGTPYGTHAPSTAHRKDVELLDANAPLNAQKQWTEDPVKYSPYFYSVRFLRVTAQ